MDQLWANRAASAEAAIAKRHYRRLWRLPGTQLGVVRLAAHQEGPVVRQLELLVAGAPAGLPGRRAGARPAARAQADDRTPDPRTPLAQHVALDQRLLRRHGLAGAGAGARGQPGRASSGPRPCDKLADQFLNAWVPEDGGGIPWRKQDQFFNAPANGPAGDLPGPLRPVAARPADGRLDRRDADRPGHPPGVRRHQGRLAGARAVHLLPGRRARPRGRTRRPHRGRPPSPSACAGWSPRSPTTWRPTASSRARAAATAGCSTASWRATSRWRPTMLPERHTRGHGDPRHRQGTGAEVRAVGVGQPADRRRPAAVRGVLGPHRRTAEGRRQGRRSSSRVRSTPRRSPSGTCRCSCRAGC